MAKRGATTDELDPDAIPADRRRAAAVASRIDHLLGRLVYWRIAAVLFLGSLMLMAFAVASVAVGQTRSAVVELGVATLLLVVAVIVARKRRRFTELDIA